MSDGIERFTFDQSEDGQIYVREGEKRMLHAQICGEHDVEVQITSKGRVEIDKLYGPLIMWPVRVRIDFDECEWVVEREYGNTGTHTNEQGVEVVESEWREVARIPGQLDSDFSGGAI